MLVGSGLLTSLTGNSGGLELVGCEGKGLTSGGGTFSFCCCCALEGSGTTLVGGAGACRDGAGLG